MSGANQLEVTQLRSDLTRMSGELKNALPSHITPEKFQRVVLTVVNMAPDLMKGDRLSLLGACLRCAADGLIPDGREAALVMFKGKPTYMPMVTGLLKRARNSGEISTINAHVIHENDDFVIELGDDEKIKHVPAWNRERGKMIGVYAIAKLKDGGVQRAILSAADVAKIKASSAAGNAGPWGKWEEEMWKKSALRRLTKYLPMDAEVEDLFRRDDENDRTIEGKAEPPAPLAAAPSKLDALEATIPDAEYTVDDSTGEVLSGEVVQDDAPSARQLTLVEQVEACESTEQLVTLTDRNSTFRAARVKISGSNKDELETAIKAKRHGLGVGP
jgi:recombination protein RecT